MPSPSTQPRCFSIRLPRPLWIGLAAVMLIVVGVALRFGLASYHQQVAIREIERLGGYVECEPGGPDWLREWLGDEQMELFDKVVEVSLNDTTASDETLNHLRWLAHLRGLYLNGTQITDAGLTHLQGLRKLQYLNLADTPVTDAGIAELKKSLPKVGVSKVPEGVL